MDGSIIGQDGAKRAPGVVKAKRFSSLPLPRELGRCPNRKLVRGQ